MRQFIMALDINQSNISVNDNRLVQNDNFAYQLVMTLKNGNTVIDLTGCSAFVHFVRGDNTFISDPATITDDSGGIITYDMPSSIVRKQGRLRGEVHVYGPSAAYRFTTPYFDFDVRGEIGAGSTDIGSEDVLELQNLVTDLGQHIVKSAYDQSVHGLSFVTPTEADDGKMLVYSHAEGKYSYAAPTGMGTVTSIGLSLPNIFSVSNSPITTSGDLTAALANQSANMVLCGPSSGDPAVPAFRALAAADIPEIPFSKVGSRPTALSGYGITDAALVNHSHGIATIVLESGSSLSWDTANNTVMLNISGCTTVQLPLVVFGTSATPPAGTFPKGTMYVRHE